MTAALLILTLALTDIVALVLARVRSGALTLMLGIVSLVAWAFALTLGFGAAVPLAIGIVLVACLWSFTLVSSRAPQLVIALCVGMVVLVTLVMIVSGLQISDGPWQRAWSAGSTPLVGSLSLNTVVVAVAVALFLAHSANLVVRAMLARARRAQSSGAPSGAPPGAPAGAHTTVAAPIARSWSVRGPWRWVRVAVVPPQPSTPPTVSTMRGGRWIGPLERWALVALGLVGALPIIAALMAGKGIIRFPEISADRGVGSKAEEFLVGSLLSWSLAGAGLALIVAVAHEWV